MSLARTRMTALALVGAAAVGVATMTGVGLAASPHAKAPTKRTLSVKGVELKFNTTTVRAPSGRVRLTLTNRSDLAHNVALRGRGLAKPKLGRIVGRGKTSQITVTLPAGRYTYYCSVFGHEAGGMRGTLIVTKPAR